MKTICVIIISLGLAVLGIEKINNFEKIKIFYASFNPRKYYYRDTLLVNIEISPSNGGSNKTLWIFQGYCKSDKLKNGISVPFTIVEDEKYRFDRAKIPIWRITTVKKGILYRRKNNVLDSPFSYNMRDYWFTPLIFILTIPSLICYLYLRNQDKNKKIQ